MVSKVRWARYGAFLCKVVSVLTAEPFFPSERPHIEVVMLGAFHRLRILLNVNFGVSSGETSNRAPNHDCLAWCFSVFSVG